MSTHRTLSNVRLLTFAVLLAVTSGLLLGLIVILVMAGGPIVAAGLLALLALYVGAWLWFGPGSEPAIAAIIAGWTAFASVLVLLFTPWLPLAVWDTLHRPTVHEWSTCDAGAVHDRTQVEGDPVVSVANSGREC